METWASWQLRGERALSEARMGESSFVLAIRSQRKRSETQMTLGAFVLALRKLDPGAPFPRIKSVHSCRKFYCDLAFDFDAVEVGTVAEALALATNALGETFTGFGDNQDYMMGKRTPIWNAPWGERSGEPILGVVEGKLVFGPDL